MKNWSIKIKLVVIAGVSIIMLSMVAATGWIGVAKVGGALNEVGLRNEALRNLVAMRLAQLNMVMAIREGVAWNAGQYESEPDKRQLLEDARNYYATLVRRLDEDMKAAGAAFEGYAGMPRSDDEERLWIPLQQQWQGFKSASEAARVLVADLASAQDWPRVQELAQSLEGQESLNQPLIAAFERDLNALLATTREASNRAGEAGGEAQKTVRTLMVSMFLLAIVMLVLLCLKIISDVVGSLERLRKTIVSVAESNDFRIEVGMTGKDEIVETANAFDQLIVRCRGLLVDIASSASRLSSVARDTAAASERLSSGSSEHEEAAAHIGGAIKQVTEGLGGIAHSARHALERAQGSGDVAVEGATIISGTSQEMDQIVALVGDAGVAIDQVDQQFGRITLIMNVIKDVADQTSLLALNAAIEAARAGETGRGFAVVADEVRKLAERTTKSTDEIGRMIGLVQESSKQAVEQMKKVIERVGGGKELSNQAAERICTIRDFANEVRQEVEAISIALAEQNHFAESIRNQLEAVETTTSENCLAAKKTADVSAELRLLAEGFQLSIGRFKI